MIKRKKVGEKSFDIYSILYYMNKLVMSNERERERERERVRERERERERERHTC